MPGKLPASYRELSRFAARYRAGEAVYEQGAVPERFFVVLSGRIHFEIVDANGDVSVVAEAGPGDPLGHVAAFTGRPTSAAALMAADGVLLAIPVASAVEAFRVAPELALRLIELFTQTGSKRHAARPLTEAVVDVAAEGAASPSPRSLRPVEATEGTLRLDPGWDGSFFFSDTTDCPVCGTDFEFLRVRTSAVRPVSRESDFRIVYASEDPTRYSTVACPQCGFAAYLDDFRELADGERSQLVELQSERDALGPRGFRGPRDLDAAALALDLAMHSYAVRRGNERRSAVLLHRRAWVEREREQPEREREFLHRARDAYRRAFEQDTSLTDEAAMRAAYVIGDLSLRLADGEEASRWLETATRFPSAKGQSGVLRMAQERLQDARQLLRRGELSA